MKRLFPILVILMAVAQLAKAASPSLVNGIAVIVNENIITFKDVQNSIREDIDFLERRYASQPAVLEQRLKDLQESRIEELVEYQLVLHEYKTAGYSLPESFFESRINEDMKKYENRLTLIKTLQAQGLTYETYREKIREKTILEVMFRQKVPNDPLISPAKIENYYVENREQFRVSDQVRLKMIVLTNRSSGDLDRVALAGEIAQKIKAGADFAEMAKVYSNGSQAIEGGDWGLVEKKVLRDDLSKVAFSLKPGQLSEVIETPQGAYLMKVDEILPAHIRSLSEVRDQVEQTLKTQETKRLRKQFIGRLKAKSFVRYF